MKPAEATRRRFFAPEVVQTSAMDCGPATLKCLLEGFGIHISYGRLREACQTDVDGTSIDTIEEIAGQLGLEVEQTVLPVDHVLLEEARALPALVVVRQPNGLTHFVVAWRRHGQLVQLMDPATGRRWTSVAAFRNELYVHEVPIPASYWRRWAEGEESTQALSARLGLLGVPKQHAAQMIEMASADVSWRTFAALDATTRMVDSLVTAGGLNAGSETARILEALFQQTARVGATQSSPPNSGVLQPTDGAQTTSLQPTTTAIPKQYWSVRPAPRSLDGEEQVLLRGAVLMRVLGKKRGAHASPRTKPETDSSELAVAPTADAGVPRELAGTDSSSAPNFSPELVAALAEPPTNPARELLRLIRADGLLAPGALVGALLLSAGTVVLEAVLLRGLFDLGRDLTVSGQRLAAMAALSFFAGVLLFLEMPLAGIILRMGRRLEFRLRIAFFEKLPRLADRYFQSRLMSDMAERSHTVQTLRTLPELSARFLRACFGLVFTAVGIAWLDPASGPLLGLVTITAVGLPFLTNPLLTERDLRIRTHLGALGRFYLDSLLGLVPIRAHGAERNVRSEHEGLLVEWVRAGLGLQRVAVFVEGVQVFLGIGFGVWLLLGYLSRHAGSGGVLLLVYWALNLPVLAEELALLARQYPGLRSVTLRLLEPLGAPEESAYAKSYPSNASHASESADSGVAVTLRSVTVRAAGHTILEDVTLSIAPGEHLAVVGPSGAGKSSLVGLLLGWHRPAAGELLVDGEPLDTAQLQNLRRHTTWVDPAVQLWNRSLLDNLVYGTNGEAHTNIGRAVQQAELLRVLEKLPDGLQTRLGEGGALVSGGEGQRVRFGRALLRQKARLVILDEPFRGLDREQRRLLMDRARTLWRGVTLLCITHDIGETLPFERVLVIEGGRLVEDASPATLAQNGESRYAALLGAERAVREELWSGQMWRRQRLEEGKLVEIQ